MEQLVPHLLCATQQAAIAAAAWVGRGAAVRADGAAVSAMRAALMTTPGRGTVVIGEGEKDAAPMLHDGEMVGTGVGAAFDLAVDPLENTTACAHGADGAITVLAAAPQGVLWSTPGWYLDKLVVGPAAVGAIDIAAPVAANLAAIAHRLDKPVEALTAVVLAKPRHGELVAELRSAGARVSLIPGGDVLGALRALLPDGGADLLIGVGGAAEGVITACSVRLLGGDMQARLAPQSDVEAERVSGAGQRAGQILGLDDLVAPGPCAFLATGVTGGDLLQGPLPLAWGVRTHSLLLSPLHPGLTVEETHDPLTVVAHPELAHA